MSRWGIQYLFIVDEDDIIRAEHLARESRRRSADALERADRCKDQGGLEVFMLPMCPGLTPMALPPVCAR